ncbi:lyase family protein [Streptomyces sp. NPDC001904]|uniref:lyase family protein n=1 Tax=Streptomyces sp. NPDC001904 TaxID=3154531 RepID=UPI00332561B5
MRAGTPAETATGDEAWLRAMVEAEAALARAQADLGALPQNAALAISETARDADLDVRALALAARESANPVVGMVKEFTRAVAERDACAAEFVHRGSTSQDILDTASMLVTRRVLVLIRADLRRSADALARLARTHRGTVMAGRTLALHAVPTTFGLKAAGWREAVLDADDRLADLLKNGLPVSLGGAAGTLAGYLAHAPKDADVHTYASDLRDAFARETGLIPARLPWHVLRAPVADIASALCLVSGALGKMAADVQSLTRTEVAEVKEPHVNGRGSSSAMPQKRNPVLATLIRSAALQVPALASVISQCMMTEDERSAGAWHAEWEPLRGCLRLVGGAAHTAAELTGGLIVSPERMAANLELTGAAVVSERLAAALTPLLGPAVARDLTSAAADRSAKGEPLDQALAAELAAAVGAGAPSERWIAERCDPGEYTGAAGVLVDEALRRVARA